MAAYRRGFTLLEIVIALIIVGILAAFMLPNLTSFMEQSNAQIARNNLLAILATQSKFNEDYGSYCIDSGSNPTGKTALCADNVADLNTNLLLGLSGSFSYNCTTNSGVNLPYLCYAKDGTDTLTLDPTAVYPTNPVACAGPNGDCYT